MSKKKSIFKSASPTEKLERLLEKDFTITFKKLESEGETDVFEACVSDGEDIIKVIGFSVDEIISESYEEFG